MLHPHRSAAARLVATLALALVVTPAARAQQIPNPEYVTFLPAGMPMPVAQQPATARFQLYGDTAAPGYVDAAPRDGIDDRRAAWLMQVATRFAPWMVRNTVDFPMDWKRFTTQGVSFPLFVDQFDVSYELPRRIGTQSIDLRQLEGRPCPAPAAEAANDSTPDCRLLALLERWGPDSRSAPTPVEPGRATTTVMYFDFPGDAPATWAREFEGAAHGTIARKYLGWSKSYVHPFVAPVPGRPDNDPAFQLVLQYWFFYPYNDAGNVHEGDWEHVNVVVTTRAQGKEPMRAEAFAAFLANPPALDELLIREVHYYFHHWVFKLDYWAPNVYLPRDAWKREVDAMPDDRIGEKDLWATIRAQAYLDQAETRINTHPVVYIGGDNRGLQQLISAPTRLGRASHGSYPFPGLYKDVGPQGTGEKLEQAWDAFRKAADSTAPESERVVRLDNPDRLELLPDWERVLPLVRTEPEVRAQWAWLVLPVRFGYPATRSPFAGIVKYAETGNLSIPAPPFNGGWNRAGEAAGYDLYEPHRLSAAFPASLQDNFQTGWGFFNFTVPTIATLPGFDIIFRTLSLPLRLGKDAGPAFFNNETVPFRTIGVNGGVSSFAVGEEWWGLIGFPELFGPLLEYVASVAPTPDSLSLAGAGMENERATQWSAGISLHLGRRVVSESSLRHSTSSMRQDFVVGGVPGIVSLEAQLDFWEYVGSFRYNLATESFQPFVKGGYGLSWYRLTDVNLGGAPLGPGESRWVRKPGFFENLLPNTWHLGAGFEYVPIRSVTGVDVGLKADVMWMTHNLGVKARDEFLFVQDTRIYRWVFGLAGTVSF